MSPKPKIPSTSFKSIAPRFDGTSVNEEGQVAPSRPATAEQHALAELLPPRPPSPGPQASAGSAKRKRISTPISTSTQQVHDEDAQKHYAWVKLLNQKHPAVSSIAELYEYLFNSDVLGCTWDTFFSYGQRGHPVLSDLIKFEADNPDPNKINWTKLKLANANSAVAKVKAELPPIDGKPQRFRYPARRLLSDLIKTQQTTLQLKATLQTLLESVQPILPPPLPEASQVDKLPEDNTLAFMEWLTRYDVLVVDDDKMKELFTKLESAGEVTVQYTTFAAYMAPKKKPPTALMEFIRKNPNPKKIEFDALSSVYAASEVGIKRQAKNQKKRDASPKTRGAKKQRQIDQSTRALRLPPTPANQQMAEPLLPVLAPSQSTPRLPSPGVPASQATAQVASPGSPDMAPNMLGAVEPIGLSFGEDYFWASRDARSPSLVSTPPPASPNPFQSDPASPGYGTNPFDGRRASPPPQLPWTRQARSASMPEDDHDEDDDADLYAPPSPPKADSEN